MYKKLPALIGRGNPCFNCPPIEAVASMSKLIAVGFGDAHLECDGKFVWDGERIFDKNGYMMRRPRVKVKTFKDAEKIAVKSPRKDWRVVLSGPLHREVYQRQGKSKWVLVESGDGFA